MGQSHRPRLPQSTEFHHRHLIPLRRPRPRSGRRNPLSSRESLFLRPSRTVGRGEACRTLPSVALETCALEQRSSRATSFNVSNFLCGSIRRLRRWRPKNGGASISEPHREGARMSAPISRKEGFAHREEGSRRCFGMGNWYPQPDSPGLEPSLRKEPKSGFPNGQSGTPVCSGSSAFSRCAPRYRPALEPPKGGAERGAPNCSKCSPFSPFAPRSIA